MSRLRLRHPHHVVTVSLSRKVDLTLRHLANISEGKTNVLTNNELQSYGTESGAGGSSFECLGTRCRRSVFSFSNSLASCNAIGMLPERR